MRGHDPTGDVTRTAPDRSSRNVRGAEVHDRLAQVAVVAFPVWVSARRVHGFSPVVEDKAIGNCYKG